MSKRVRGILQPARGTCITFLPGAAGGASMKNQMSIMQDIGSAPSCLVEGLWHSERLTPSDESCMQASKKVLLHGIKKGIITLSLLASGALT